MWFKEGLKFQCTECGKCCTGSPGYVFLTASDIEGLSSHLGLKISDFLRRYTRYVEGKYALLEKEKEGYDCIFLKDKRCAVYSSRPIQCKTFPWWPENIESEEAWQETKMRCEGIDSLTAPIISLEEIEACVETYLDSLLEESYGATSRP